MAEQVTSTFKAMKVRTSNKSLRKRRVWQLTSRTERYHIESLQINAKYLKNNTYNAARRIHCTSACRPKYLIFVASLL